MSWFAVSLITIFLFKIIPKKMKGMTDPHTRSSLYTILILLGVPLLMISVLAPPVFIIGDKNISLVYEIIWGGLCLCFVIYFVIVNRKSSKFH
jgi:hypothetical protein